MLESTVYIMQLAHPLTYDINLTLHNTGHKLTILGYLVLVILHQRYTTVSILTNLFHFAH